MKLAGILALLAIDVCLCSEAIAQTYPTKPVRVVVAPAFGSGVDAVVRMVTPKLSETWSQPVVVDNRPGAGGTIGSGIVAMAAADGYTLLAHSSAHVVSASLRSSLPYDPLKDFTPVAPLTSQAYILVVGKPSGIKSVRELIAAAKARPGELKFTSAGIGTGTHLMAEKFNVEAGVKLTHVPTTGGAAGNEEVVAGRVTYWFSSITPALPYIRDGRLLVLGVSSAKRLSTMPEIPTVAEAGLPGYDSTLWYGMWAPAGTPKAVVERIAGGITHALATLDVRDHLAKLSAEVMSMTPVEFARFVRGEAENVARIVKTAGIKPQ